jgi:transcriptional regulator with XRE-family HTH domain
MTFYDRFVYLCSLNGKSPSAAALAMGFNKSAVSNWKRGRNNPSDVTLQTVAHYFHVPKRVFAEDFDFESFAADPFTKDKEEHQTATESITVGMNDPRVQKLAPFINQMTDAEIEKVLGYIQGTIAARK